MTRSSRWSRVRHRLQQSGVLIIGLLLCSSTLAAQASEAQLAVLEAEITRLAEHAQGKVGVGAIHLETGGSVYLHANERFPMASTYKVPIAVQLLHRVDNREVRLEKMVTIKQSDLSPGGGMITPLLDDPGVELSLHNILELMLIISDNSSTDLALQAAGGGGEVTSRMRSLGVSGIRVDRPTIDIIADWIGIQELPSREDMDPEMFRSLAEAVSEQERERAESAFDGDPRDTATPLAMARLLERIWRGEVLSRESTALILDIMRRCQTGENRIKGILPPNIEVAHKTGTIGGTTNDVGIITLPEEVGHVVTVIFVKESKVEIPAREKVIAQISRAIYDFFLFTSKE